MGNKPDILNLSMDELIFELDRYAIKPFRARQIFRWLYTGRARSFSDMTDISKQTRQLLSDRLDIGHIQKMNVEQSEDGTKKYLFRLADDQLIETVLIQEENHFTLCISSQVGCAQGCAFCLTAKGGLIRNLTRGEILSQIMEVERDLADPSELTNIVVMGMGEPLHNYDPMISALKTVMDADFGLKYSGRRITLSTAGVVPNMARLGRDITVNLAVSLNATDNETRNRLMPINRKYPMEKLLEACRIFPLPPRRRITFEYILMEGVNDSPENAEKLAKLLGPIRAKVNLIPFNEHAQSEFRRPQEAVISEFQDILIRHHYTVMIRNSKGRDISAACGQLRAKTLEFSCQE
ncbi:MAG: 23S rRNA (adenine(2503)-C(2))-methyltransferase RlmN [Proteobacteria bacterium]|nr:23S rRNA (adenine(2503)-C(2))-methyltransferase RlmN [Pseudomonadota bacterium]MBU4472262.1 23S rRNA (adenine(2503)-C(2))-methyltransferase RlmN [Pseudomonadota bacterium]